MKCLQVSFIIKFRVSKFLFSEPDDDDTEYEPEEDHQETSTDADIIEDVPKVNCTDCKHKKVAVADEVPAMHLVEESILEDIAKLKSPTKCSTCKSPVTVYVHRTSGLVSFLQWVS
jgi:hypothetical protein